MIEDQLNPDKLYDTLDPILDSVLEYDYELVREPDELAYFVSNNDFEDEIILVTIIMETPERANLNLTFMNFEGEHMYVAYEKEEEILWDVIKGLIDTDYYVYVWADSNELNRIEHASLTEKPLDELQSEHLEVGDYLYMIADDEGDISDYISRII